MKKDNLTEYTAAQSTAFPFKNLHFVLVMPTCNGKFYVTF